MSRKSSNSNIGGGGTRGSSRNPTPSKAAVESKDEDFLSDDDSLYSNTSNKKPRQGKKGNKGGSKGGGASAGAKAAKALAIDNVSYELTISSILLSVSPPFFSPLYPFTIDV